MPTENENAERPPTKVEIAAVVAVMPAALAYAVCGYTYDAVSALREAVVRRSLRRRGKTAELEAYDRERENWWIHNVRWNNPDHFAECPKCSRPIKVGNCCGAFFCRHCRSEVYLSFAQLSGKGDITGPAMTIDGRRAQGSYISTADIQAWDEEQAAPGAALTDRSPQPTPNSSARVEANFTLWIPPHAPRWKGAFVPGPD